MRLPRVILGAMLLAVMPSLSEAAAKWIEIKSPHFTIVSSDNVRTTRNVIWEFEQVRSLVATLWPWARVDMDRPLTIVSISDQDAMAVFVPESQKTKNESTLATYLAEGPDRNYIVIRSDVSGANRDGVNLYYYAYWSYLQLILDNSPAGAMPPWFRRGLVSVVANTSIRDNEIQIGRIIPWHLRQLQQRARLSSTELIQTTGASPWLTDTMRRPTFDAQSWAFVHMLMFGGDDPARGLLLDQYLDHLRQRQSSLDAFKAVYGDPAPFDTEFSKYIARPLIPYGRFKVDLRVDREKLEPRSVSDADVLLLTASFHAKTGKRDLALVELERARAGANAAAVSDLEGILLDRANDPKARAAYEQAVAAGSSSFYSYFRLAAMNAQTGESAQAHVVELLTRSLELNVQYVPALIQRSIVRSRLGKRDEALGDIQLAAQLAPNQFNVRIQLAQRLNDAGRPGEALTELQRAKTLASTDAQRTQADALTTRINASAPPAPPRTQTVGVPEPQRTKSAAPVYPPAALTARVQGPVVIEATVGMDGHVTSTKVITSIPLLDQAAIDAVRQWEYAPTIIDGVPVPVTVTVSLNFRLP